MEDSVSRVILNLLCVLIIPCGCQKKTALTEVRPDETIETGLKFKDHNLVFVSFDALQASHVGAYGHTRNTTPTIDSIAKQGILFEHVYSVASWTVPASMTWFTGVYPSEHRMTNKFVSYTQASQKQANLRELSPNLVTLAEVLKKNGYATGGFTGNAGVSGGFGYEQGFDVYFYEKGRFGGFDRSMPRAIDWLRENKHKKFFLFLHGYDCHGQYAPAEGFDDRFVDATYDKRFTGSESEQELLREEGLEKGKLNLRDADVQFWRSIYDEKINRADAKFRSFLDEFEKLGIGDKTLFVITSDHGTEVCEHRRLDHGFTLYNEQIHVPLVIKLPHQTDGRRIDRQMSSIDLMPTILDLLDVEQQSLQDQLRGQSFVPIMRGDLAEREYCYSETDYREYTFKRSVIRSDGWKLILTMETKNRELFNLKQDPTEALNLINHHPEIANDLENKLYAHFKKLGHDLTQRRWQIGLNPVYASQGIHKK